LISIEFLQPPYTWNYFVWRNVVFLNLLRRKNHTVEEKIFSEEIAKYDDTNELKEEQRNDVVFG
jgi:hypothetical protein